MERSDDETIILSVKEYALLRDRSVFTIRRWINDKKIKATKLAEGHEWEIEITKREYEKYRTSRKLHRDRPLLAWIFLHAVTIAQVTCSIA